MVRNDKASQAAHKGIVSRAEALNSCAFASRDLLPVASSLSFPPPLSEAEGGCEQTFSLLQFSWRAAFLVLNMNENDDVQYKRFFKKHFHERKHASLKWRPRVYKSHMMPYIIIYKIEDALAKSAAQISPMGSFRAYIF